MKLLNKRFRELLALRSSFSRGSEEDAVRFCPVCLSTELRMLPDQLPPPFAFPYYKCGNCGNVSRVILEATLGEYAKAVKAMKEDKFDEEEE